MLTREQIEKWHTMAEEAIDAGYLDEDLAEMVAKALGAAEEPVAWRHHWKTGSERDREWEMWTYGEHKPTNPALVVEALYARPAPILDAKANNGLAPLLKNSYEAGFIACREEAAKECMNLAEQIETPFASGAARICAERINSLDPDAKRPT